MKDIRKKYKKGKFFKKRGCEYVSVGVRYLEGYDGWGWYVFGRCLGEDGGDYFKISP